MNFETTQFNSLFDDLQTHSNNNEQDTLLGIAGPFTYAVETTSTSC